MRQRVISTLSMRGWSVQRLEGLRGRRIAGSLSSC